MNKEAVNPVKLAIEEATSLFDKYMISPDTGEAPKNLEEQIERVAFAMEVMTRLLVMLGSTSGFLFSRAFPPNVVDETSKNLATRVKDLLLESFAAGITDYKEALKDFTAQQNATKH